MTASQFGRKPKRGRKAPKRDIECCAWCGEKARVDRLANRLFCPCGWVKELGN